MNKGLAFRKKALKEWLVRKRSVWRMNARVKKEDGVLGMKEHRGHTEYIVQPSDDGAAAGLHVN